MRIVQQRFTGGEEIDKNGNYVKDQRGSEYIASPSPEVDAAWSRLLLGMIFGARVNMSSGMASNARSFVQLIASIKTKVLTLIYP